jgi:hypothetical protein
VQQNHQDQQQASDSKQHLEGDLNGGHDLPVL